MAEHARVALAAGRTCARWCAGAEWGGIFRAPEGLGPGRPTAAQQRGDEGAVLSRTDLRELGLERRAIDVVFRECPVIVLPGYSRPMVRASDYLALLEGSTYCDRCGDRVRRGTWSR
jgi:hypothetical protein